MSDTTRPFEIFGERRGNLGKGEAPSDHPLVLALAQIIEFDAQNDGDEPQQREPLEFGHGSVAARPDVGGEGFFFLLDDPLAAIWLRDLAYPLKHRRRERIARFALGKQRQDLVAAVVAST